MLTVYGFGAKLGLADPSPFVLKLLAFLRIAKLEYQYVGKLSNMNKAPKGKLPFIDDDTKRIPDSNFIISHLCESREIDLDRHLDDKQKLETALLLRFFDDCFYWYTTYGRWSDEDGWKAVRSVFFNELPTLIRPIAAKVARKQVLKTMNSQGIGRYNREEVLDQFSFNIDMLSKYLGSNSFFMGEKVSLIDAAAYGFLAQFILAEHNSRMNVLARESSNLVDYCKRMHRCYFPELTSESG